MLPTGANSLAARIPTVRPSAVCRLCVSCVFTVCLLRVYSVVTVKLLCVAALVSLLTVCFPYVCRLFAVCPQCRDCVLAASLLSGCLRVHSVVNVSSVCGYYACNTCFPRVHCVVTAHLLFTV